MATDQERKQLADRMRMQSLATCNNYYYTGQYHKALNVLNKMKPMFPDDEIIDTLMGSICRTAFGRGLDRDEGGELTLERKVSDFTLLDFAPDDNGLSDIFGKNWTGGDLKGKSITVFCDQGMGDIIHFMRYLGVMAGYRDCIINLNCYAHYEEMKSLMNRMGYFCFIKDHVQADYHTNIMSIPALLNGLHYECYYPAHFRDLLDTKIPIGPYISVEGYSKTATKIIGLAWKSNPKNPLVEKKSIDLELFKPFMDKHVLFNLLPEDGDFLLGRPMDDMLDTARTIEDMDLVISVDTAALHLAGAMGKPVWGLLPYSADPRWGKKDTTPWYPSMKLYRQKELNNWEEVLERVVKDLAIWQHQEC